MINLHAIVEFNYVAASFASINKLVTVEDSTRMVGMHHSDANVIELLRAAFVHFRGLPHALLSQPAAEFGNSDNLGIVPLRDLDGITNVVAMPMRAEKDVHRFDVLLFVRTCRIAHDPRVDEDDLALRSLNAKSCMSQPSDLYSVQFHD